MKKIKKVESDRYIADLNKPEYTGTSIEAFFYAFAFFALLFIGSQILK